MASRLQLFEQLDRLRTWSPYIAKRGRGDRRKRKARARMLRNTHRRLLRAAFRWRALFDTRPTADAWARASLFYDQWSNYDAER